MRMNDKDQRKRDLPLFNRHQNPSWQLWPEKKNKDGWRKDQSPEGHRRIGATADVEKGKKNFLPLEIEFQTSPHLYQSKKGSGWAKKCEWSSTKPSQQEQKNLFDDPLPVSHSPRFSSHYDSHFFVCKLTKETPWLQRRNDEARTPEEPSAGRVSIFPFFSRQRSFNFVSF